MGSLRVGAAAARDVQYLKPVGVAHGDAPTADSEAQQPIKAFN